MKREILYSALILSSLTCFPHNRNVRTTTVENYATGDYATSGALRSAGTTVQITLPDMRDVKSGSKLVVTYEGDWPVEMQGAFDYAVRIWEEVLPVTLPINITAKLQPIRGNRNTLSKVTFDTFDFEGDGVSNYTYSMPLVKSVLLQEYHSNQRHRFMNEITDFSDFEGEDIIIVYNKNLLDQFSFSLDGAESAAQYDFVTLALRDIAIGLGYTTSFTADAAQKKMDFTDARLTPYESLVMRAIGSTDPATAYANATKGSLSVPLNQWGLINPSYALSLYAPEQWDNNTSLRFLMAEANNPLSLLLRHDFAKGYTMQDMTGMDWDNMFGSALDWRRTITTGTVSGTVSCTGTTDDIIPYKGAVSLTFDEAANTQFMRLKAQEQQNDTVDIEAMAEAALLQRAASGFTDAYCKQFNHFSVDGPTPSGISLSVMKKDGTWDCVYSTQFIQPVNVNIENLQLHYDEQEYARGVTGGLRYRLTQCSMHMAKDIYYDYKVKYFTRDFTPEKPVIKYMSTEDSPLQTFSLMDDEDDYYVDVKVGIANVEGVIGVVVEQWDEGEELPFQYDAEDFRNGYFIANLDRELSTRLTVASYNANGFKRSETITIPPIGYPTREVTFKRNNDVITLGGISGRLRESGRLSCRVNSVMGSASYATTLPVEDGKVDVSAIPQGVYVLTVLNGSDKIGTYKFLK